MEIKSGWTISPRKVKVVVKSSATSWRFAAIVTTKGTRNTQRSVSMTMNRSIEEPCEVTSLMHGSGAERRGRLLRLGNTRTIQTRENNGRTKRCSIRAQSAAREERIQTRTNGRIYYQTNGTSLYVTFFLYSSYPSNSLTSMFSSPMILPTTAITPMKPMIKPYSEPSSRGAPRVINRQPRYNGCLTKPYTPVEMTCCLRSVCILTNVER